jgi:hypothetical protein
MKIIQSFAYYKEGNSYISKFLGYDESQNPLYLYKNFYTFLLSYLTLHKYYGDITMICNKEAHDKLLKYIPYDNFLFLECEKEFEYWSTYKIDAMKAVSGDIIHVDSDVFIFNDLFRPFIQNKNFDMMVQHKITSERCFLSDFFYHNLDFFTKNNIIDVELYDNCSCCTSVFGLREMDKENYFKISDALYNGFKKEMIRVSDMGLKNVIIEEFAAYLGAFKNKLKIYEILPQNLINECGENGAGDKVKYTHLWFGTKFKNNIIKLVKNKIKKEFPDKYCLVENFDDIVYNRTEKVLINGSN